MYVCTYIDAKCRMREKEFISPSRRSSRVTLVVGIHSSRQFLGESCTNSGQEFSNTQIGMGVLPMMPIHRGRERRSTRSRPGWVTETLSKWNTNKNPWIINLSFRQQERLRQLSSCSPGGTLQHTSYPGGELQLTEDPAPLFWVEKPQVLASALSYRVFLTEMRREWFLDLSITFLLSKTRECA